MSLILNRSGIIKSAWQRWQDDPYIGWAGSSVTGHLKDGPGNYTIIHVTNLNASGAGSFREALEASGNRVIVFDVGGICDLQGNSFYIFNGNYTVCGKTAPSPGFHVEKGYLVNRGSNSIWEHVGLYSEGIPDHDETGDAACIYNQCQYVIFDHCNLMWGLDEILGLGGRNSCSGTGPYATFFCPPDGTPEQWRANSGKDYTVSNCIIAEGTDSQPKGTHVNDNMSNMVLAKNLYLSGYSRQGMVQQGARVAFINNYTYNSSYQTLMCNMDHANWESYDQSIIDQCYTYVWMQGNVVHNGPTTIGYAGIVSVRHRNLTAASPRINIYVDGDNLSYYANGSPQPITHSTIDPYIVTSIPSEAYHSSIVPISAYQLRDYMRRNVGMRPWDRDDNTRRVINELLSDGSLGSSKALTVQALTDYGYYPANYRECNEDDYDFDSLPIQKKSPFYVY